MARRTHEGVEARGDVRVALQVFPEGTAEDLLIGRRACPHRAEQATPCVGHAAAEAVEIEAETRGRVEQQARRLVQREPAWDGFLENPLADEVFQHPVQGIDVGARCRGQVTDLARPRGDAVGDPQRHHDVDTPRCAEIAQRPDVHSRSPDT